MGVIAGGILIAFAALVFLGVALDLLAAVMGGKYIDQSKVAVG